MLKLTDKTDTFLPPEFMALGINKIDPWVPTDSLALLRFASLGFTRNWSQELLRKIIGEVDNGSLKDLVDEIAPVSAAGFIDQSSILDESDMQQNNLLHPQGKTL